MKRVRLERWGSQFLSSRAQRGPRTSLVPPQYLPRNYNFRSASTTATQAESESIIHNVIDSSMPLEQLPSPPISRSSESAKLSALHSRLSLPTRLPVQTLARTLVDPSADSSPEFNNRSLSILGSDLLGYYTSEHFLCNYPRLPMSVLWAAQWAYVGPKALAAMSHEWGIENAATPGGEVDPGLLQFRRTAPPPPSVLPRPTDLSSQIASSVGTGRPNEQWNWNRGVTSRIVYDDQFGDMKLHSRERHTSIEGESTTLETASAGFVRAVVGAVYIHAGRAAAKRFVASHFLSRHLDVATLFDFRDPTRDLSRLCAREGFEAPIARLLSETGRMSRHPVFVVGVFSGTDKLGEGAGSSLNEARFKAAAAALKSWYLYQPLDITVPSEAEGSDKSKQWLPNMVDCGEVII